MPADKPLTAHSPAATHVMRGVVCAIAGGTLWGFSGSCAQFLLSGYAITPMLLTSIRMMGAGILFLLFLLLRDRRRLAELLHDRRAVVQVAVFGIVGLFLSQLTYVIVIDYTNAGTATVLQCTSIVFVMLATCVMVRRLPRRFEIAGLVLACAATWLIATQGDPTTLVLPLPGLVWGIANGLAVAFYIVYPTRLLQRFGSAVVTGCGMFAGGVVACCVALPTATMPTLDAAGVAALAALIVLGSCGAFALYLQGVADAGPVRASMLGVSEPVAAMLISWLWLGTSFTGADIAGFLMMVAMVLIITGTRDR